MRNKLAIVAFGGNAMLAADEKGTARERSITSNRGEKKC
jgi:hypothetical protein